MTDETTELRAPEAHDAGSMESTSIPRTLLLVGTPLALAVALWFHPAGGLDLYASLASVADTWLPLHFLLLGLFGLLGGCLYVLLEEYASTVATVGRIGVATYLVFYVAFEAIAGIATGLFVQGAASLPPAQQEGVATALEATIGPALVLALVGTTGAIVAVAALATELRADGAPATPVALLAGLPVAVFAHGGARLDALAMAAFTVGILWLEFGRQNVEAARPARTD